MARAYAARHCPTTPLYGTNLVTTGADPRTAQTLLRHANLQTTAIYVGGRREACRGYRPARPVRVSVPYPLMMVPPAPPSAPIANLRRERTQPQRSLPQLAAFLLRAGDVVAGTLQGN
jgi:hypothetical protein